MVKSNEAGFRKYGVYSNDKMVASFTLGFWTFLFTKNNYRKGGKTLLKIFPNKAKGKNQADIYLDLTHIREFRNRIAHHEPICFDGSGNISTAFARKHYQLICDYISYFGQKPNKVINWAEKPDTILIALNNTIHIPNIHLRQGFHHRVMIFLPDFLYNSFLFLNFAHKYRRYVVKTVLAPRGLIPLSAGWRCDF